jgi:hypothetical protein
MTGARLGERSMQQGGAAQQIFGGVYDECAIVIFNHGSACIVNCRATSRTGNPARNPRTIDECRRQLGIRSAGKSAVVKVTPKGASSRQHSSRLGDRRAPSLESAHRRATPHLPVMPMHQQRFIVSVTCNVRAQPGNHVVGQRNRCVLYLL